MRELEPKAPEILQNIEWVRRYGKRYWKHILVFAVIVGFPLAFNAFKTADIGSKQKDFAIENRKPKESGLTAPRVTFIDGSRKTVELTVTSQLNPDLLLQAHSFYGSSERAIDSLQNSIKGAAIEVMEKKSEDYVRTNREKVASEIIQKTSEAQKRTGYIVYRVICWRNLLKSS